ncbi:hypothetical protein HH212_07395 [Massilia forsythiae]|uniref:Uncharacterized protein n=1 Tax=Massilia forsythiae TaxID=2728020 RepID=A0A7Z2VVH5_9BURK|nr:cytochrome oxidase putative small subunit CydP [Massilia forsythiae]QJD99867.1 hypothetical protein HH212_07395 [Massilia forsythiae]
MTTVLSRVSAQADSPTRHQENRHQPRSQRLALTLCVTIAIKCLLLYGLWYACFSHPQTKHMLLPADQVQRHLFSTPAAHGFSSHPSR